MTRRYVAPPELLEQITPLIVHHNGRKALRDADLARLFGVALRLLYQRIERNLWICTRNLMFQLTPEKRSSRSQPFRPGLAFTHGGVIAIAGLLNDATALRVAPDIALILQQRRRSKRAARRSEDPIKAAKYERARAGIVACFCAKDDRVSESDRALASNREKAYARLYAAHQKYEASEKRTARKKAQKPKKRKSP